MRAQDLTPVNEVSMTPQDFGQALEQGANEGMRIGFEFETYVKRANLPAEDEQVSWNALAKKFRRSEVREITEYWTDDEIVTDKNIDVLDSALVFNPAYPQLKYKEAFEIPVSFFLDIVKRRFAKLPEDKRIKVKKQAYRNTGLQVKDTSEVRFAAQVASILGDSQLYLVLYSLQTGVEKQERSIYALNRILALLSKDLVGRKVSPQPTITDWDTAVKSFPDLLGAIKDITSYQDGSGDDYESIATALQPVLSQAVGRKVHVFGEYHEKNKNATDWYIEPDGSLKTQVKGGSGVEIVTPPLNAREAMAALKQFYTLARQYDFMTDRTTGLHINISIPKKLDPMKLAVFLGDEHVLRSFGRKNNEYARSVLNTLQGYGYEYDAVDIKTKKGQTASRLMFRDLTNIARNVMFSHTASISGENTKYFSFRHAGGNYLADMNKVIDTVGRFARAMLIASDPNAYREEYIKKLTQLISSTAPTPYSIRQQDKEENSTDLQRAQAALVQLYQTAKTSGMPIAQYWSIADVSAAQAQASLKRELPGVSWTQVDLDTMQSIQQSLQQSGNRRGMQAARKISFMISQPEEYPTYMVGQSPTSSVDISWVNSVLVQGSLKTFAGRLEDMALGLTQLGYDYDDYSYSNVVYAGDMYTRLPLNHPQVALVFKTLVAAFNQLKSTAGTQPRASAKKIPKRVRR